MVLAIVLLILAVILALIVSGIASTITYSKIRPQKKRKTYSNV